MEIIANALQTVQMNQNVYFTDTVVNCGPAVTHRAGSGLVTLRGLTNQCRARYHVTFGANIAVPTGETVGPVQLSLAIDGEAVPATNMIVTPAAVEQFFNVFSAIYIDVPRGCCITISVTNSGDIPVNVENANLIVDRVA